MEAEEDENSSQTLNHTASTPDHHPHLPLVTENQDALEVDARLRRDDGNVEDLVTAGFLNSIHHKEDKDYHYFNALTQNHFNHHQSLTLHPSAPPQHHHNIIHNTNVSHFKMDDDEDEEEEFYHENINDDTIHQDKAPGLEESKPLHVATGETKEEDAHLPHQTNEYPTPDVSVAAQMDTILTANVTDKMEEEEAAATEAKEFVVGAEVENTYFAHKMNEVHDAEEKVGLHEVEQVDEENVEKTQVVDMADEMEVAGETEVAEETGDTIDESEVAEETGDTIDESKEMTDTDIAQVEERVNEDESELADMGEEMGEEMEVADEAEKVNETEEMEGAEEEVARNAGGKRKRGKNAKAPARAPSRKKMEEDVCFICFDGGELVLCDRRGCPKAYHPSCVNRDDAFFQTKGRWNCGWHLCSSCGKNAHYMCFTCTFSLCKGCIREAVIFCVRGNKGFCETCMKTVMMIERNEQGDKEMAQVDFNDKNSWEYLFKDYWTDLKERLSLSSEEIGQAKNPWKGSDLHAGKQESAEELYDAQIDEGSGSDGSSGNTEVTTSKRRKYKKRLKSRGKDRDMLKASTVNESEGASTDESTEWASKELLEFVMHMKNGDKSVCSQFDVQALLLEYIKRNKLRDPRRKSQIICDLRLENLFGKPRVGHFEMLKLLESHFLLKEDSHADDLQGGVVDTEANQLEADGNSLTRTSKDKRRKSRKKGDGRGLQSNLDDYAAIDMHNINLIYLRRSLVENLVEDIESFPERVVGAFVRIRISGSGQKQDLYRLVQVVGTSQAGDPYRVGKKMTNFLLEILNLDKTEIVSMDIISNQEFTEDECKRLRQSIKCGLINRLTVGDIQEKAMALQAVRVEDILESEITRLSHLRDRASDLGRRKELRECVEKLQLLKSPEERQRRLEEVPEIHADPKMDPTYESDDNEGETEDRRQENYPRPRGSGFSRRGKEPVSPRKGGLASTDSWGGSRSFSGMNRELTRSLSNKGFSNKGDDATNIVDEMNEKLWSQGRDKETQLLQVWEKPKTASSSETRNTHSALMSESVPRGMSEMSPTAPSTAVTESAAKTNETDKIWHYQDPSGKIQGPFSMVQLRKWNNTGYFPSDLKIWRTTEKQDDSILLTDALAGNFQKEAPSVDNNLVKTQLINSPHLSSSFSGNAGESWKSQPEISNSAGRAALAPLEVSKNSTDRWASETNLPSPTPARTPIGGTKGQAYDSNWSPTPAQPAGSLVGANPFSRGSGDLQRSAVVIPESGQLSHVSSSNQSGHVDGLTMSHGASSAPKAETSMLMSSTNASLMHSQLKVSGESPRVQVNSHLLPTPDSSGSLVNANIDMKTLQNLIQPLTSNNNSLVGTQGWLVASVSKSEMNPSNTLPAAGPQAWGSSPSQKLEPHNSIPMPGQPNAYGNWGDTATSVPNSASSFTSANPTGFSAVQGTPSVVSSDPLRALPGQSNIQPSASSNSPRGMAIADNQSGTQRQGAENQNSGWASMPANPSMAWGAPMPANSNQGWVAHGQGPPPGNTNPGWVAPPQGQVPRNTNPGWAAPPQGQALGTAFQGWGPPGQAPAQVNANPAWGTSGQGLPSANANPNWGATSGNRTWGNEKNNNGDRFSSQRDRGSHGGDSGYGGNKPWNRQSSFGRGGDSSRSSNKGQRVCKYYESGHCKKGSSCDYLHT